MTKAVIGLPLAKQEIASEIYSRMSRERMSVRGAEHSDSSQIAESSVDEFFAEGKALRDDIANHNDRNSNTIITAHKI